MRGITWKREYIKNNYKERDYTDKKLDKVKTIQRKDYIEKALYRKETSI